MQHLPSTRSVSLALPDRPRGSGKASRRRWTSRVPVCTRAALKNQHVQLQAPAETLACGAQWQKHSLMVNSGTNTRLWRTVAQTLAYGAQWHKHSLTLSVLRFQLDWVVRTALSSTTDSRVGPRPGFFLPPEGEMGRVYSPGMYITNLSSSMPRNALHALLT
jgi:hypothetical protein